MKRFLAILLALLVALPLFACEGGDRPESADPVSGADGNSEGPSVEPAPEPTYYDIVYYRFYADEADALALKIKETASYEPQVIKYDQTKPMPEHAIYIGEVTDGVGNELCRTLHSRDHGIKAVDGNVYIYGGSRAAVKEAVSHLAETFADAGKANEFLTDAGKFDFFYEHEYALAGLTVGGRSISDYTVIYSATNNEAKYSNVASAIKSYLGENADVSVQTAAHARSESECEILLGCACGRALSDEFHEADFAYNEYRVTVSGTKVAIVGGNACAVWQGWKAFCEYALQSEDRACGDTVLEGTAEMIKVACVGDSITIGINSTDPYVYTYPNYLQEMLGYDYYVRNFGASGYSVVNTDEYAYYKHDFYRKSQSFSPDVVIWMLGTNDGNPGQSYKAWEGTNRKEKYIQSAEMMFEAYEKVNPDVQIFISLPATLFESTVWTEWKEWGDRIVKYVIPLNKELAEKHGYPTIDMYTWSLDHASVFPDGLHPKDTTYKTYAQRVYDEIINVIKTPSAG